MSDQAESQNRSTPFSWKILLAFAAIYVIWGSTYLAIKIGIETVPPFLFAGTRFLFAGGVFYAALRLTGAAPKPTVRMWKWAAIIGTLMMVGGNGLVTWAEQTVPSGLAALLIATMPIWMVLLDATVFGSARPGKWVVLGLVMGFFGVTLLIGPSEGAVDPLGALVLIVAALSWATGSLMNRSAHLPKSPWLATAMEMIAGGAVMLVFSGLLGEWGRFEPSAVSLESVAAFFYLTVFGSLVALSAYVYLLRETTAAAVSTYAFVNPVIALGLGLLVGEVIAPRTLVGAILIVGAVVLIHRTKYRGPVAAPVPRPTLEPASDASTCR